MSLVITSNESTINGNDSLNTGINLPYQYHNYLTQPLEIEPDSEVAVQSVKAVKTGNFNLNRSNNCFYVYFGDITNAVEDGDFFQEWTTGLNVRTFIGDYLNNQISANPREMVKFLETALNNGFAGNPMLIKSPQNVSGGVVSAELESGSENKGKFLGFTYTLNQGISASNTDTKATMNFENLFSLNANFNDAGWTPGNLRITKLSGALKCNMVATGMPMSIASGSLKCSFKEAGGGWEIGLGRYMDTLAADPEDNNPSYFVRSGAGWNESHYDYVAKSVYDDVNDKWELRVYHSLYDDTKADNSGVVGSLQMIEFKYWLNGPSNGSLTAPIEVFTESASYGTNKASELTWTIKNEQVSLLVESSDGTTIALTLANGTGTDRAECLKPTSILNRYMYPRVVVEDLNKYVVVDTYQGVKPTGFIYGDNRPPPMPANYKPEQLNMDFWARCFHSSGNQDQFGREVDKRYMFSTNDTSDGPGGNSTYTQLGLNASTGLAGNFVLILKDDSGGIGGGSGGETGFTLTQGANAGEIMGFGARAVMDVPNTTSNAGQIQTYESTNTPDMVSKSSMFVRLSNFPLQSYNGQTTQPSKILYHMPRFDNSGTEFGALFFEPPERTYLKLNNSNKLVINDFDLSLVNADETLADNITGKTIIVLHIRKSR